MLTSRMFTASFLVACLSAANPAQADTELRDRFIAAGQQMGEGMLEVMKGCAPDIDTSEVDLEYTPRMTEAVSCVVDRHIERFGRDETVALVEQAEAMGERPFSSLQEMATIQEDYPKLSTPAMAEFNQACGMVEASQDSSMARLMQENMAELTACFSQ